MSNIEEILNKIKEELKVAHESMDEFSKVGTEYSYWNGEYNALKKLKTWIEEIKNENNEKC